jgi:hypothetical protein
LPGEYALDRQAGKAIDASIDTGCIAAGMRVRDRRTGIGPKLTIHDANSWRTANALEALRYRVIWGENNDG